MVIAYRDKKVVGLCAAFFVTPLHAPALVVFYITTLPK
jgi:hypothetical protein